MVTLEERVAFVEGKMNEQSQQIAGIREAIVSLEQRMDHRFESVDRRFETIDRRFEAIDRRFESLEQKLDQRFLWTIGLQVTTLVAIVSTLLVR